MTTGKQLHDELIAALRAATSSDRADLDDTGPPAVAAPAGLDPSARRALVAAAEADRRTWPTSSARAPVHAVARPGAGGIVELSIDLCRVGDDGPGYRVGLLRLGAFVETVIRSAAVEGLRAIPSPGAAPGGRWLLTAVSFVPIGASPAPEGGDGPAGIRPHRLQQPIQQGGST
jgi:hypothetical protein